MAVAFVSRRTFLATGGAALLGGCMKPLLDEDTAKQVNVAEIIVDTSAISGLAGGRNITKTPEQIRADVRGTLRHTLATPGRQGARDVTVKIALTRVALVSPGQSLLIGGISTITGVLTVVDSRTGDVVVEPVRVAGTSKGGYAPGGIIGALATAKPEEDYRRTVSGFAFDVRRRIFGE